MAKDWTEDNLDAQIQTELTSGEYWEIQADMWRNKYLDAADEIERLREENQRQRERIMLLNSLVQTEHEIIRIAALREKE